MVENKKIEQDLREIDIRIKDLKVNRRYDFKNSAISLLSSGAIVTLVGTNRELDLSVGLIFLIGAIIGLNTSYSGITISNAIVDKGKQIKNLKFLKNYLQSHDVSKISIDEIDYKIANMKKNDKNNSNLIFLKHYLENNSLSHDDMNFKYMAKQTKK